jgi:hypothetical protein
VLAVLAAVSLAACGSSAGSVAKASPTPSPTLEAGWKPYTVTAEGFVIAVPGSWDRIDLNLSASELASAFKDHPEFVKVAQQVELNKVVKLFAVDNQTLGTGFATNLNVIVIPVPDTVTSLDQVVTAELATFTWLQISPAKQRVRLRAGDAEQLEYTLPTNDASGAKVPAAVTQWVLLRLSGQRAEYVITLTTRADQASTYATTFGKIADTFSYK